MNGPKRPAIVLQLNTILQRGWATLVQYQQQEGVIYFYLTKVLEIWLNRWIMPMGGDLSGRVCAYSLHSMLVYDFIIATAILQLYFCLC